MQLLQVQKLHATLLKAGVHGDTYRCNLVLNAYVRSGALADARRLLELVPFPNLVSYNTVLSGYASSGRADAALDLLDAMPQKDSWSWNTTISGLARACRAGEALRRFLQMTRGPVSPDGFTYSIISPCCNLDTAGQVHARAMKAGACSDTFVGTGFVRMYAELGRVEDAWKVFDSMPRRDLMSWNVLLDCYMKSGTGDLCFQVFVRMIGSRIQPDEFTFATLLNDLAEWSAGLQAMQVHSIVLKCGYLGDLFVCNSLLNVYGRCGCVDLAKNLFDVILEKDVVSWTVLISGLAVSGYQGDVFEAFGQMRKATVLPNSFTFGTVISSCASANDLGGGRQCHALSMKHGLEVDAIVGSSLLDMYSKCGEMDGAIRIFKNIPQRDVVSWNAMICGLAQNGQSTRALELYDKMVQLHQESLSPNSVTFVGILSACSHAGALQKGCSYFAQMVNDYCIEPKPEHYACLVDLFARAGWLDVAEGIITALPFEPDATIWDTFLSGCRKHGNLDMAKCILKRHLVSESSSSSTVVLLSNMFLANEEWDDALELREAMIASGADKVTGTSWIDVGGQSNVL